MKLFQITLLAAGITASAPPTGNLKTVFFNCVGLRDEVRYAHPKDCTKFFKCSNGVADVYDCPQADADDPASKLEFNNDLKVCDWPANFTCDGQAAWQKCGAGRVDGTAKYPGYDTSQYFTCSGGTSSGLTSCTGSDKFDAFRRECVAYNDTDLVTWETLADNGKNVNTFDANYANENGENVTFEGSDTYKTFYGLTEDKLNGNDDAVVEAKEYIFNASKSFSTVDVLNNKKSATTNDDEQVVTNSMAIITFGEDGALSTTEDTTINLRMKYTSQQWMVHGIGVTHLDQIDKSFTESDFESFWENDGCSFVIDNSDSDTYWHWCEDNFGFIYTTDVPTGVDLNYEATYKPLTKEFCLKVNGQSIGCVATSWQAKYFYARSGEIDNVFEITS